jgi:hypothetical protein
LLIDSTHTRWIIVTAGLALAAVGLHGLLGWNVPGGLRGNSAVGLWYGVAGSLLMLFAGALSAHRRLAAIRWLPMRRWIGSRQTWLRGHIWLGLLSVVFILCHSNYRLGGPLEMALWGVLAITILSGIAGLLFQIVVPRVMTSRVTLEAPYEQISHLCDTMRRQADELVAAALAGAGEGPRQELHALHQRVRAFLVPAFDRSSVLADPFRAELCFARSLAVAGMEPFKDLLGQLSALCDERRQFGEQARLQRWLHLWLLAHVPITIVLLVLGVVHAVTAVIW